jgi:hypothetical protein
LTQGGHPSQYLGNEQQPQAQQQQQHHPPPQQRHSDPLGGLTKEKLPNFSDLARTTPPFKDYLNNLQTYAYLQSMDNESLLGQVRHNQITQQYSSSTDEGCDTDHGGEYLIA